MNAINLPDYAQTLGAQAKQASALMAKAPAAIKNKALRRLAELLRANVAALQIDNARDIDRAVAAGLARLIGAVIEAEDTPGTGLTMVVSVPLALPTERGSE